MTKKTKSADEKSADFLTNIYSEARNLGGETVQDKAKQARERWRSYLRRTTRVEASTKYWAVYTPNLIGEKKLPIMMKLPTLMALLISAL